MTDLIGKIVVDTSGNYLGKIRGLDYVNNEEQRLIIQRGYLGNKTYVDLDKIEGVGDRVIVEEQQNQEQRQ